MRPLNRPEADPPAEVRPKLLLTFEPGGLITEPVVAWCREHIATLEIEPIGPGLHYVQEDHGPAIGKTIAAWMRRHRPASAE